MATYATGYSTASNVFQPYIEGLVYSREVTFTVATALSADDVIEMIPVYAGEQVVGVDLITEDLDTNGSPTIVLDVGDGGDSDRYIDGATVGQAGGAVSQTVPTAYTYTATDTIDVTAQVGAATGATSVDITLRVLFRKAS